MILSNEYLRHVIIDKQVIDKVILKIQQRINLMIFKKGDLAFDKKNQLLRFFSTIFLLLFFNMPGQAQTTYVDSLRTALESKEINVEERVNLMIELGKKMYYQNTDSALNYANNVIYSSEKISYTEGIGEGHFLLGRIFNKLNNPDEALKQLNKAENYFIEIDFTRRLGSLYNNIGLIYKALGDLKKAFGYMQKSLKNYQAVNDENGEGVVLTNIGIIYGRLSGYQKAVEYYIRALKISEELNDKSGIAYINGNIGNVFLLQKDYDNAVKYFHLSKRASEELKDKLNVAKILNSLGYLYQEKGELDQAYSNYNKSLILFKELDFKHGMATIYGNLGRLEDENNNYNSALANFKNGLGILKELNDRAGIARLYNYIGILQTKTKNYQEALLNLGKGLVIAREVGLKQEEIDNYKHHYELYLAQQNYQQALTFHTRYSELKDSVFNMEKNKQISKIRIEYETEKKEQENELLRQEKEAQYATISRKNLEVNILIISIILFLVFAIYYYRVYQQKKVTNLQLASQNEEINKKQAQIISINESLTKSQIQLNEAYQELQKLNSGLESTVTERTAALETLNHELDTFLYQSSHALRRPVVSVMGLTQLARMEQTKPGVKQLYDKIDDTLIRMDLMLKKLVMASEINFINIEFEQIDFDEMITNIKNNLADKLKIDELSFNCNIPRKFEYLGDKRLISVIFQNLIENAMLYHNDGLNKKPSIEVSMKQNRKGIDVKIHDNGIGISENVISNIFNMFMVGNDRAQGYGLGLYLVKKAVERLNGTIDVNSKKEEYTTFYIHLPFNTSTISTNLVTEFNVERVI